MILVGIDVAKDKHDCSDKVDAKTIALMLATESDENCKLIKTRI